MEHAPYWENFTRHKSTLSVLIQEVFPKYIRL